MIHYKYTTLGLLLVVVLVAIGGTLIKTTGGVIQERVISKCIDTDDGIDPYQRGTVIADDFYGTDYCADGTGAPTEYCRGKDCFLTEHFCKHANKITTDSGYAIPRNCPLKLPCYRGECVEPKDVPREYTHPTSVVE